MNILIAECRNFPAEAARMLGEVGRVRLADLQRDDLPAALADVDVLWVRLRYRIDAALRLRPTDITLIGDDVRITADLNETPADPAIAPPTEEDH